MPQFKQRESRFHLSHAHLKLLQISKHSLIIDCVVLQMYLETVEDLLPLTCENKTETRATQKGKRKKFSFLEWKEDSTC